MTHEKDRFEIIHRKKYEMFLRVLHLFFQYERCESSRPEWSGLTIASMMLEEIVVE